MPAHGGHIEPVRQAGQSRRPVGLKAAAFSASAALDLPEFETEGLDDVAPLPVGHAVIPSAVTQKMNRPMITMSDMRAGAAASTRASVRRSGSRARRPRVSRW
jgi:hypothetical protein